MQTALSSMNAGFGPTLIGDIGEDTIAAYQPSADTSLVTALERHPGLNLSRDVLGFIATWPTALQRAVQAVLWENFTREARVPVTFAWQPAYDYSVTVHDVADTAKSTGGITVVLTSRYPDDIHPLTASSS